MATEARLKSDLTPGALAEIPKYLQDMEEMREEIRKLRSGETNEDQFRGYRLVRGIYGQRQKPDLQMVRVKVPWGRATADQLECLADVADKFPGADRKGLAHVTTRQAVQFHFVKLDTVPDLMKTIAPAGLTTREACSNTVRNVTADALAGVAADEVFDIAPYAEATVRYFLRHPCCQSMPRKFKISFSGSAADRGLTLMHDIGAMATVKDGVRGFKVFVGGGLGPTPKVAHLFEDFTPAEELLKTIEACIIVFDRDWDYGRKFRNMARVKFLIEKIGFEEFKKRALVEREKLDGKTYPKIELFEEQPPEVSGPFLPEIHDPAYLRWKSTNVEPQKQKGWNAITIRLHLGDIRSDQLRALAQLVRRYSNGTVRTVVNQNLLVRWVKDEALYSFYHGLAEAGLNLPSAQRLADITSCPGADTCQLGITSSRGLATAIGKIFQNGHSADADLKDIKIKISGCPNSCGQHHVADIGFFGGSKTYGTHQVPTYTMLLGGHIDQEGTAYGKPFLRVPAKKIPALVGRLLDLYKAQKSPDERFRQFVQRVGFDALKKELEPLSILPESPEKDFLSDWGEQGEFKIMTGKGECAA